ncbi:MAG: ParA family protein [Planctomycetes bacterium]|nr:ParA family protein [Planctomycetota bacterium]
MTRIVAVTNSKGGVAKSTTAVNIAAIAANMHSANGHPKVLLIDFDQQGSCTHLSNVAYSDNNASAMFQDEPIMPSELATPTAYNYDIIQASPSLLSAADWIYRTSMGEQRLSLLIKSDKALRDYDYIIIDTAGDRSRLTSSVLYAADSILIPVEPSSVVTMELIKFLETIDEISNIREAFGLPILGIDGIFFSRVPIHGNNITNAAKLNIDDVKHHLEDVHLICKTIIPSSTIVEQAHNEQQPVVIYSDTAAVSVCYKNLYNEIYGLGGKE